MTSRLAVLASAVALAALAAALACATQENNPEPVVKMLSTTVTNQTWFDVANCQGQPPVIPARASDGVLIGLLQSANPQIMECLANPKNRGAKERTAVTVATKVPETGVPEHTVSSDNITPEGEACIRGVLAKLVPTFIQKASDALKAASAAKAEKVEKVKGKGKGKGKGKEKEPVATPGPVTVGGGEQPAIDEDELHALKDLPPGTAAALVKFVHDIKVQPAIRGDVNEVSTYAGQIRLALPSFCSCFEAWKGADPAPFQLIAVLPHPDTALADGGTAELPPEVSPASVTVTTPEGDATAGQVAACVKDQMTKMSFKTPVRETQVPYNFQFINSSSGKPLGSGEGWAKYQQIEEVSRRAAAEAAIAVGARSSAQTLYDQLVTKFKKNAYSVAVPTLIGKCKELLKADDAWLGALQKQLETEQTKQGVVAALVKENAKLWSDAEKSSSKSVEAANSDLGKAKDARQADERACPVVKK